MLRRVPWILAACALVAAPAAAQLQNDLLDVFTIQIKPEKTAQFEAVARKITAANRQNGGSDWLAVSQEYGPGYTIRFISTRDNFAAIESSSKSFMAAMAKAYGQAATEQIFHDIDACTESSQSEIRRRRWDLSANAPADAAAMARLVGEARFVQTTAIRVQPGQGPRVEEQIRLYKAAAEKATPKVTVLVSQAVTGQTGTVFYLSTLRKSLAEIDGSPSTAQLLGQESYAAFLKVVSESVLSTDNYIGRYRPDLSNPASTIVAAAPDFWSPAPALASKGAKGQTGKATAAKKQQ
jgi:quinol monooxygenase YgiN